MNNQPAKARINEFTVDDKIDKAMKQFAGTFRRRSSTTNRADAALALSILSLAAQQGNKSKAKALLDLLHDLGF
ncbi:MAG: hypothetical protein SGJ18_13055 [Pseudomonadota bacterium]|nr:hypothetical protein [Pseudomonadota bacterium]